MLFCRINTLDDVQFGALKECFFFKLCLKMKRPMHFVQGHNTGQSCTLHSEYTITAQISSLFGKYVEIEISVAFCLSTKHTSGCKAFLVNMQIQKFSYILHLAVKHAD